jgi:predicted double-glycine peptidase
MDPLTVLWVWKAFRFMLGLLVTYLAWRLGKWRARQLQAHGLQGSPYTPGQEVSWKRLAGLGALLGGIWWFGEHLIFLEPFLPSDRYRTQFGLVTLRSLLAFLGAMQMIIDGEDPRWRWTLVLVVVSCLVMTGIEVLTLWPMVSAIGAPELDARSGVVIQSTGYSCAPSSLATICRLYGRVLSEREAALAMAAGLNGTTIDEMALGAQAVGFPDATPVTNATLDQLAAVDRPALLSIEFGGVRNLHAVALLGLSSTTVYIADPLVGLHAMSYEAFARRWDGEAVFLGAPSFAASGEVRLSTFSPAAFQRLSLSLEARPRPAASGAEP